MVDTDNKKTNNYAGNYKSEKCNKSNKTVTKKVTREKC